MTEPAMPVLQPAKKLHVHMVEQDLHLGRPLYQVLIEKLREAGIAGATIIRHDEGYGESRQIHTSKMEISSLNLPITVEAVDSPEKIDAIVPRIAALVKSGIVDVCRTMMVQPAGIDQSAEGGASC